MQIEIAIEGPSYAISKLYQKLGAFSPSIEGLPRQGGENGERSRIVLVEASEDLIDDKLLSISRIAEELEKDLALKTGFDFRVRNLYCSEPPTGSHLFRRPFKPISSITIQPWHPSLANIIDARTIIIDPHNAFGTGKHPTTRLCLESIDNLAKDESPDRMLQGRKVLDFGCGTGLLAIVAVKLGAESALGVEIDHECVQAARRNVDLNNLSGKIVIKEGSWEVVHERYDLILANLVPSVLFRTGRYIPHHLKDHGRVVVSGFGNNQVEEIKGFFMGSGLIPAESLTLEGWSALIMIKEGKH